MDSCGLDIQTASEEPGGPLLCLLKQNMLAELKKSKIRKYFLNHDLNNFISSGLCRNLQKKKTLEAAKPTVPALYVLLGFNQGAQAVDLLPFQLV